MTPKNDDDGMPPIDIGDRRLSQMEAAMMAAIDVLGPLSMATEGTLRGRICTASNALNAALGRTQSSHGDQF